MSTMNSARTLRVQRASQAHKDLRNAVADNLSYKNIPFGRFNMPQKCYICKGTGLDICPRCFGREEDCRACGGRGVVKCYACGGRGIV